MDSLVYQRVNCIFERRLKLFCLESGEGLLFLTRQDYTLKQDRRKYAKPPPFHFIAIITFTLEVKCPNLHE